MCQFMVLMLFAKLCGFTVFEWGNLLFLEGNRCDFAGKFISDRYFCLLLQKYLNICHFLTEDLDIIPGNVAFFLSSLDVII